MSVFVVPHARRWSYSLVPVYVHLDAIDVQLLSVSSHILVHFHAIDAALLSFLTVIH